MIEELKSILGICCVINVTTKHDVFFSYAPHTNSMYIELYYLGYDEEKHQDLFIYFCMNECSIDTFNSLYSAIENLLCCTEISHKKGALNRFEDINNVRIIK